MQLYLLQRIKACDFSEYNGFVIRANSPEAARKMAAARAYEHYWTDTAQTSCEELEQDGPSGIVLQDFKG